MNKAPGFLALKNQLNVRSWLWRWHLRGGCMHWKARDLADQRTDELRKRGRAVEVKVRQARRELHKAERVVSLARLRIERAKRIRA